MAEITFRVRPKGSYQRQFEILNGNQYKNLCILRYEGVLNSKRPFSVVARGVNGAPVQYKSFVAGFQGAWKYIFEKWVPHGEQSY